jgi:hypothetical protein
MTTVTPSTLAYFNASFFLVTELPYINEQPVGQTAARTRSFFKGGDSQVVSEIVRRRPKRV